jgi:hypothetical protein
MGRPQEKFAREIHNELTRRFAPANPEILLSLYLAGTNSRVFVSLLNRSSTVHCFALRDDHPEFLTLFQSSGQEIATARTSSMDGTVRAVSQWLDGEDLTSLYKAFPFVDHWKRRLLNIQDVVVQYAPCLENASELKYRGSGLYHLWFRDRTRSARIYYYGKNDLPDVTCHWDDCELFKFHATDLQFLANVLMRWLCDETQPSEMRKEFPALSIGKLADYYEAGKPIEGEFIESWDHIERFYDERNFPPGPQVLELIKHLRSQGYDRTLRAGQSMFTFILSRSRRHGLRADQSSINFEFQSKHEMQVSLKIGDNEETFVSAIAPSHLLTTSLDHLAGSPVD